MNVSGQTKTMKCSVLSNKIYDRLKVKCTVWSYKLYNRLEKTHAKTHSIWIKEGVKQNQNNPVRWAHMRDMQEVQWYDKSNPLMQQAITTKASSHVT